MSSVRHVKVDTFWNNGYVDHTGFAFLGYIECYAEEDDQNEEISDGISKKVQPKSVQDFQCQCDLEDLVEFPTVENNDYEIDWTDEPHLVGADWRPFQHPPVNPNNQWTIEEWCISSSSC